MNFHYRKLAEQQGGRKLKENSLAVFEDYKIRRVYDEDSETWYFSVVDIIQVLIQQPDYQTARKYWNKLKERLKKEGSQSVTNCHQLKMSTDDSKLKRLNCAVHRAIRGGDGWGWGQTCLLTFETPS
jgi:hypothetical protein